jgi:hypothetical protein
MRNGYQHLTMVKVMPHWNLQCGHVKGEPQTDSNTSQGAQPTTK